MNALEYGQSICPEKLLPLLEKLGDGFHGEAYLVPDNKVVKYSLISESMIEDLTISKPFQFFIELEKVMNFQIKYNHPAFVKIFDFNLLSFGASNLKHGLEDVILYSTTMEKLNSISPEEKKLFKTIVHQYRDIRADWSKIIQDVREQSSWLDFDLEKVVSFIYLFKDSPIEHHDMSSSNILKDNDGNFKLIDLDFSRLKDLA
jgi:serine/threonine protein kinase